jgi:hypothetical protein
MSRVTTAMRWVAAALLGLQPALVAAGRPARVPERVGDRFAMATWGGRIVVPPHFDALTPHRDGVAAAMRNGRWGLVDLHGRWIGQPKYDWIHPDHFDHGPALVSVGGLYGYVGRDGVEIVAPRLEQASPYVDGHACLYDPQAMRFGIVDAEGLSVTGFRFDECDPSFRDGLARVRAGALWGYVDRDGEVALAARYDRAEPFSEGLALVEEAGLRAFIEPNGDRVIPANVEAAGPFVEGRAWVRYGPDQVGFIDRDGRPICEPRWRQARSFSEGIAWVQEPATGRWSAIDLEGERVFEATFEDPSPFSGGVARVARAGLYGAIDRRGREVIPLRYATMGPIAEGLTAVTLEPGGLVGVVDLGGRPIIPPRYEQIGAFRDRLAPATRCRWIPATGLGSERQVCDAVYVDRRGRERSRRP